MKKSLVYLLKSLRHYFLWCRDECTSKNEKPSPTENLDYESSSFNVATAQEKAP
jgi:hypothetical protein